MQRYIETLGVDGMWTLNIEDVNYKDKKNHWADIYVKSGTGSISGHSTLSATHIRAKYTEGPTYNQSALCQPGHPDDTRPKL